MGLATRCVIWVLHHCVEDQGDGHAAVLRVVRRLAVALPYEEGASSRNDCHMRKVMGGVCGLLRAALAQPLELGKHEGVALVEAE